MHEVDTRVSRLRISIGFFNDEQTTGLPQSNVTSHINGYLCVAGKESYFMEDNAENKSIT